MSPTTTRIKELAEQLEIGDLVFIRVPALPFKKIASTTQSWTNHVGIVVGLHGAEPVIAESRFPLSSTTPLSRFIARSESARVAVRRLVGALNEQQRRSVVDAARHRLGILYDAGFDLHSRRQFCSRFVHEVLIEATGVRVGEVETFASLLACNPDADIAFWRLWYFGRIPWRRETVTPASLLRSSATNVLFDGCAIGVATSASIS